MRNVIFVLGAMVAPFCLLAADKSAPDQSAEVCGIGSTPILEMNGAKLSMTDLEQKDPAALFPARSAYYDAERKAIDDFVTKQLLDDQAKREHLTVNELLEKHVTATLPPDPPEVALRVYYEGVDTTQPYEAVRPQILSAIRQRRMAKAKTAYLQTLRTQANIAVLLQAPRAEIAMKDVALRGPQNAPITIVEFADYECPYCQQVQPALSKLEKDYAGKVAFAYKDYPLPMHSHAQKAAEASRCAEAQGKYWEYHDLLFADKELDVAGLKDSARKLKLDETAFGKCLDSGTTVNTIKLSSEEAQALGVQGTPTFFINGRMFNGTQDYAHLKAAIDDELGKAPAQAQLARR